MKLTTRATGRRARGWMIAAAATACVVAAAAAIVITTQSDATPPVSARATPSPVPVEEPTEAPAESRVPDPSELDDAAMAALPAAIYDAVIPGLLPFEGADADSIEKAYTVDDDVAVYGSDRADPVARIPALNFLDEPTIVVPVAFDGKWALVLTPSRQELPSRAGGRAPAQSAGWVPRDALIEAHDLPARVTVSVSAQSMTVETPEGDATYPAGVGAEDTPTPVGTVGYLQARYDDPTQADYTIQLTTLHSDVADEPFGGSDGGLIGLHYNLTSTGTVSHGCVRLAYDALLAVNELPLGTPVVFVA
ncbi:L,D-transpeptidase [Microbacterium excoecariae]|uniref:L,D-transpeptidase n=1 Tax=Microbacterium excoecariae TaxID=2715210 RepID=UPI00140A50C5|nr:L,D-transpeptidase [Microbacterium excoecariae]NHI17981.1 murein L,D-transpeptidase [Microbacterium excoecariae]